MKRQERVAIDAVGIKGGGGEQVAIGVIRAAAQRGPVTVYYSDLQLAYSLNDHAAELELQYVHAQSYPRRLAWWMVSNRRAARDGCRAVLHLGNVALSSGRVPSAVLVHQANAIGPTPWAKSRTLQMRYRLQGWLIWITVRRACHVFVQSAHIAESLSSLCGRQRGVSVAVPPSPRLPAPSRFVQGEPDPPVVAYVGSDAEHKNLKVLFEAAVLSEDVVFELTVDRPNVPPLGQALRFLGPQPRQGVADLLARATALVQPSLSESANLTILEAMKHSVPVIAADLPYAHAMAGSAAKYFDPSDAFELAMVCAEVVTDSSLRRDMVVRGLARVAKLMEMGNGDEIMATWLDEAVERS